MGGKGAPNVPAPVKPDPIPTPEQEGEPESDRIRNDEARKLRRRRGMAGTILTSPLGAVGKNKLG